MAIRRVGGLLEEALTRSILGAFFDVHSELGFGYRELVYALAMQRDLIAKGHRVEREVAMMIRFRGEPLTWQTFDMTVDGKVILEIKATERLHLDAKRQLYSYLYSTDLQLGLLLHFGREAKFERLICENRYKRHFTAPVHGPPLP